MKKSTKSPIQLKDIQFVQVGNKITKDLTPRMKELVEKAYKHNNGVILMIVKTGEDKSKPKNAEGEYPAIYDGMTVAFNSNERMIKQLINKGIMDFQLLPPEFEKLIKKNGKPAVKKPKKSR